MKKMENLIKQINEFSKLAKKRKLSMEESQKREEVRQAYRTLFKKSFEQRVKNIKIVNPDDIKE